YEIKGEKSALIPVATEKADPEFVKTLAPYDEKAKANANKVIGKLEGGNLVAEDEIKGIPQCQIAESAMINLINEVQMYYAGTEVSAAAFDPKANMYEGDIKNCDAASLFKYTNTLYKVKMTGEQLKKYMEWSASYYNTYKDGDVTVSFNSKIRPYNYFMFSGINYEINISKEPGN
ncbi:MAG: 5'-nucleotidase C-terminal domain-containing protein, partial [Clostridium sp.]